jgi:peptidoglycan hydrolase CwlO-like protein
MDKQGTKSRYTEVAWERKQFKNRIKELTKSRDEWKAKSIGHKARADKLASDLKKLKTKLNELAEIQ